MLHDPASCQPFLRVVNLVTSEALRPAAALRAALGGRDSTGSYGLSAPVPTVAISQPPLAGVGSGAGVARVARVVLP